MKTKGWIKFHRKIQKNKIYRDNNAKIVLLHILINCDENGKWEISRNRTSQEVNLKPSTFRDAVARLRDKYEIVTTKTTGEWTDIQVMNWELYQQDERQASRHDDDSETTSSRHSVRNKESKNLRNNIYNSLRSLKEFDFKEIAESKRVSISTVKKQYDALVDYCESKGKRYKNYKAALRNFVSKAIERDKSLVLRKEDAIPQINMSVDVIGREKIQELKKQHGFLS